MIAKHPKTAIYTLIAVILVMALAVGCTFTGSKNQTDPAVTTEPPMTTTSSEDVPEVTEASVTSFSEGEVQAVLLYVSGNLYARNETILEEELPEGYALAGTVLEVNDRREPEEEFHATHLPVGAEVYTAPDNTAIIYVKDADTGLYRRMFRADISGDWWSKKFQVNAIPGFDPIGELMSSGSMHTAQRRFDTWDTMYIAAVTCLYDSPAELDLYQFFYNGIPGVDNTLTEAETAYLRSQDVGPERDVIKLPVQEMEAILLNMFGIPLKDTDMTALAELLYWEETDCYYLLDSTRYQHSITVHSVYTHETYTDIYYCIHSDSPTPDYVLTIQSIGGGIQIVSNKWLDFTPEYNGFYPEGTGLSEDATAEIAALFEDPQSWYAMATASIFATPEEVELDKLFYNGMPGEETHLTNKEKNYLYNTWLGSEIGKLEFTRVSAGDMDDVLEEYFGVSLDHTTMRGTQNFVYWDDTDCYYEAHNDAIIQDVEVQSAFVRPGGMVDVYYTADHTGTDEYYVMTLQLRGEKFVICANWYVNESTTLFQATAAGGIQRLIIAHSVTTLFEEDLAYYNTLFQPFYEYGNGEVRPNLVCCFFTSYYDSPEELDLVEFLRYNPLSTGLTEGKDYEKICQLEGWTDFAPVPVHKFEEDDIDDALETFMGISLNDLQDRSGRNGLHYLPEYDAYYNTTSDAGFGTFTADRGETLGNTIVLYDDLGIGKAVKLTLRQEGRNLLIVSHQLIEG